MCLKVEKNEIGAERADQKRVHNLPLARQFALTAVKTSNVCPQNM